MLEKQSMLTPLQKQNWEIRYQELKQERIQFLASLTEEQRNEFLKEEREASRDRQRRWREANPEQVKAMWKNYNEANKEKISKQSKEYREANKERITERGKKYYEANKERIQESRKEYNAKYDRPQESKEKQKEKRTCECGAIVSKSNFSVHLKTNAHLKWKESPTSK